MSNPRRDAALLLAGSATQDLAFRLAQVALPLVVLAQTRSVGLTGLEAAASGLPVVLSPWWARGVRQWVRSGPRLAAVAVLDAGALCVVPLAVTTGHLSAAVLVLAGVLLGVAEVLGGPGRSALLSDVGDRLGPDRAVGLLTLQDLLRRVGTVAGPGLGAVAVAVGWTVEVLWTEAVAVLVAGALAVLVEGAAPSTSDDPGAAPSIRAALGGRPDVLLGWVLRGTSCATWFAFVLGLAVLGVQVGRPGVLYAAGMTGYGIGAILGTVLALRIVAGARVARVAVLTWTVSGLSWVLLAAWPTVVGVALTGALSGGFTVVGIAAVNASITRTSTGAVRRTLISGQTVVVSAASSAGMLLGGTVIELAGVRPTLVVSGLLVAVVSASMPWVVARCAGGPATGTVDRRPALPSHRLPQPRGVDPCLPTMTCPSRSGGDRGSTGFSRRASKARSVACRERARSGTWTTRRSRSH